MLEWQALSRMGSEAEMDHQKTMHTEEKMEVQEEGAAEMMMVDFPVSYLQDFCSCCTDHTCFPYHTLAMDQSWEAYRSYCTYSHNYCCTWEIGHFCCYI